MGALNCLLKRDMEPKRFNIVATGISLFVCLVWMTVSNAAPAIEDELLDATNRITIEGKDLHWVNAKLDGQHLTLEGYVPDTLALKRAVDLASTTAGISSLSNDIKLIGTSGSCQDELNDALSREKIQFKPDSGSVSANSEFLLKMVAVIARNCDSKILIIGHTDNIGDRESNQRLSERRAGAVRNYLVRSGVNRERLGAMGFGHTRPIYENSTGEGREKNQRIEFFVTGAET